MGRRKRGRQDEKAGWHHCSLSRAQTSRPEQGSLWPSLKSYRIFYMYVYYFLNCKGKNKHYILNLVNFEFGSFWSKFSFFSHSVCDPMYMFADIEILNFSK